MLENSCLYSRVPAEAVTIAIRKYVPFHTLCCIMNRKVKSCKQTVFLLEQCAVSEVCSDCCLSALTQAWPTFALLLVYNEVSIMCCSNLEVSSEILQVC